MHVAVAARLEKAVGGPGFNSSLASGTNSTLIQGVNATLACLGVNATLPAANATLASVP